jgi:hypothetical protein
VIVATQLQDAQFDGCRTKLGERSSSGFEVYEHVRFDSVASVNGAENVDLDVVVFDSGRASARCVSLSDLEPIQTLTFIFCSIMAFASTSYEKIGHYLFFNNIVSVN